jgi:hypothetical protein
MSEQGEGKLEVCLKGEPLSHNQKEWQPLDCYTLWIQLLKKVYAKPSLHNVIIHYRKKM